MKGHRILSRAVAQIGAACLVCTAASAVGQSKEAYAIVDQPAPSPRDPLPQPQTDPDRIAGIRIEPNGALITGPLDQRRVYIPFDRPVWPAGFEGVWAGEASICASAITESRTGALPDGSLQIGHAEIVGRQRLAILKMYAPLPSTFTMAMLNSGRKLELPASRYRDATKVLVILSAPDGKRDYEELTLLADGGLDLQNTHSHETAVRCPE